MARARKKEVTFKCKYCNKEYKRESSLISHMCEAKRRWNQRKEPNVIIAYNAYLKFMEHIRHGQPTYERFMKSRMYLAFVRYGNHMQELHAIRPNEYTDFLIKNGIKLTEWTKEYPYQQFVREKLAKESPIEAIERSLNTIALWAQETDQDLNDDFFEQLSTSRVLYWFIDGKISPWLLFSSDKFAQVLERMNSEQMEMLDKYIDKARWKVKVKMHKSELNNIKSILKEYKL